MATLSIDGIAIAEINTGSADQLKRLASQGLGASLPAADEAARAPGASAVLKSPRVSCTIRLEFPADSVAR